MIDESSGLCGAELGNCGTIAAVPYFISFQILGTFIFVNLVVAVILENFKTMHNVNTELASVADLEAFAEAWAEFDPDATKYIHHEHLVQLLMKLPPPLGIKGSFAREARARSLCYRLSLKQRLGRVAFHEVLKELVEKSYFFDNDQDESHFKELAGEEREVPWGEFPSPQLMQLQADTPAKKTWVLDKVTIGEVLAMQLIRTRLRARLLEAKHRLCDASPPQQCAPLMPGATPTRAPAPAEGARIAPPMLTSMPREHEAMPHALSPARSLRSWSSRKKFGLFSSRQKQASQSTHTLQGTHMARGKKTKPPKSAQPDMAAMASPRRAQLRSVATPGRKRVRTQTPRGDGLRQAFEIALACLCASSCCALMFGLVLLVVGKLVFG